ncbi:MAG: DUF977 family protein [Candidatus Spechtbacterales bacterium]
MPQFIIFLIIGVVGILIGCYLALPKVRAKAHLGAKKKANIIKEQQAEKEENLSKIREFIRGRDSVTNDEVEKLLGVSDATTERYLDDLEREGILKQEGRTGRFARYKVL